MGRKGINKTAFSKARSSFRRATSKTFVSFAGKSSKTVRRRSSLTISTKRKHWNAFYSNGRAKFGDRIYHKSCTLFCEVTFVSSEEPFKFWERSSSTSTVQEPHAEIKALSKIRDMDAFGKVCEVDMLLSYSPCARCAAAIIAFIQAKPLLEITLAFSAIFHHDEKEHCEGLRRLNSEPRVTLRVFNENDWGRLAKETDMPFWFSLPRFMEDSYWEYIFEMILKGQNHPSLPVLPSNTSQSSQQIHPSNSFLPSSISQPSDQRQSSDSFVLSSTFQSSHQSHSSNSFLPFSTPQPSHQIHSTGLILPSRPSQSSHQINPIDYFSSSRKLHSVHSTPPALPSRASQSSHQIHSIDSFSSSRKLHSVHTTPPALLSRASQSSHQVHPTDSIESSSSSWKLQPVNTTPPALPSRASQASHQIHPSRSVLPSSTTQSSRQDDLPEIQNRGIHVPEDNINSVFPSEPYQSFNQVNARHAVPSSRTFSSRYPVPPTSSTPSFRQFCPSILCTQPEDAGTDSATTWNRCAKLMRSKKFVFVLAFILFLVLLTVILVVT